MQRVYSGPTRPREAVSPAAVGCPPDPRHGLGDGTGRYVEVRDEPDALLAAFRVEEDALGAACLGKRSCAGAEVDIDEEQIRLRHGAAQTTDRLQLLGEPAGALVVLGEALEVVVERMEARRGQATDLPH